MSNGFGKKKKGENETGEEYEDEPQNNEYQKIKKAMEKKIDKFIWMALIPCSRWASVKYTNPRCGGRRTIETKKRT